MGHIRSALGGGALATVVLTVVLFGIEAVFGYRLVPLFANFCTISPVGFCAPGSLAGTVVTWSAFAVWFVALWPLIFAAFTWWMPGKSGSVHGALFAVALWGGYVGIVTAQLIQTAGDQSGTEPPLLVATLFAYLCYGVVLGVGYDYFAEHRTLFIEDTD